MTGLFSQLPLLDWTVTGLEPGFTLQFTTTLLAPDLLVVKQVT